MYLQTFLLQDEVYDMKFTKNHIHQVIISNYVVNSKGTVTLCTLSSL